MDDNSQVMEALFLQQRLQVLSLGLHHGEFSDAYLYAWEEGIYPYFEDGDHSIIRRPHELYKANFLVSKEKVESLIGLFADAISSGSVPTFNELEARLKVNIGMGNWQRYELVKVCRYFYLNKCWDQEFWDQLITPMQNGSIDRPYVREDIELL